MDGTTNRQTQGRIPSLSLPRMPLRSLDTLLTKLNRFTDSPSIPTILHSVNWKSSFSMAELVPQRGSTREASCFGVPYSEHSSFRELTMFVCALRIEKVVPTVNVGSATGRSKMKSWIERWLVERRKTGCLKLGEGEGEVRW